MEDKAPTSWNAEGEFNLAFYQLGFASVWEPKDGIPLDMNGNQINPVVLCPGGDIDELADLAMALLPMLI